MSDLSQSVVNAPPTTESELLTAQSDRNSLSLRFLFRANLLPISASYALFMLENALRLAQPFVLGLAINDLLSQSYRGLTWFIVQHLSHMLIGSLRQMYDTRVFAGIYRDLASEMVLTQRGANVDISRIAARSAMSRAYIEFFERHMPMLIRATWSIVGGAAMLYFYDPGLLPWCIILVVPALILNCFYGRKTFLLSGCLHNQLENEVDVIHDASCDKVRDHYGKVGRWQVRLSDAEAINFIILELFVLGLIVAVLVQFCATASVQAGDVFAVFRYVMLFIMGLDCVPKLVFQFSKLRDIGQRMQ